MVLAAANYGLSYGLPYQDRLRDLGLELQSIRRRAPDVGALAKAAAPLAFPTGGRFQNPMEQALEESSGRFGLLDPYVGTGGRFTAPAPFGGGSTAGAQMGLGSGGLAGASKYGALDAHNAEFNAAAAQFGAPANLLKSLVNRESSGNWARDGSRVVYLSQRNDYILPFVGITKKAADSWGLDFYGMVGNKQAQINGMATILSGLARQYGGYDNAIKVYFGGPAALSGNWNDENGLSSNYYYNQAKSLWTELDGGQTFGGGAGSGIVQRALEFVGVPYVWGSLPQAGDDPWQTGWDCSAFVNWLDDKYGVNELPAGSHYQYQDTVAKGLLINDPNQLRPGDLVFFDTGLRGGGGAYLNNASHVGMYIGNGQFIQAANPGAGTIVSNLSDYIQMYGFLGGRSMQWSVGGTGGTAGQPIRFTDLMGQYLFKRAA